MVDRKVDFAGDIWSGHVEGTGGSAAAEPPTVMLAAMGPRMLRLAGLAAAGLCLIVFAAQFDTPWYSEWRHDAGTRRVVEALRADHALHPAAGVRVGTDWLCSQSLSFYRHVWHLDWIAPLDGKGPDGEYDYYVLLPDDHPLLAKRKLVKIYSDAVSGAVLAARR
jgi:hypothetical protein